MLFKFKSKYADGEISKFSLKEKSGVMLPYSGRCAHMLMDVSEIGWI